MSLRSKIALILFTVVAGVLAVDNLVQRQIFGHAFSVLEGERAQADLERMSGAFERISRGLVSDPEPWLAAWAEGPEALASLADGTHVALLCRSDGRVLWLREVDEAGRKIDLRLFPNEAVAPDHPALDPDFDRPEEGAHPSLLWTDHGLLVMGRTEFSIPGEGPGVLLLARFASSLMLDELASTGVGESAWYRLDRGLKAVPEHLIARVSEAPAGVSLEGDLGLIVLRDRLLRPVLALTTRVVHDIRPLWKSVLRSVSLTDLILALLFPLLLLFLLQRVVTGPIRHLTERVTAIGRSDDLTVRVGLTRRDEIGQLGSEFDEMIEKLALSREASAQAARMAGRSEIAVGVLHNVGNILNRVTTSASLTRQHLANLSGVDFDVIQGELQTHRGSLDEYLDSHERGKHLLTYFDALIEDRQTRIDEALGELHALTDSVQQVVRLVASLNAFEGSAQVESQTDLGELVESALDVTLSSEAGAEAVRIEREIAELGQVLLDRSRLLEVLVSLLRNAVQALQGGDGRIVVRVGAVGETHFCVEIEDEGEGIASEDQERIFQLGYTTREGGSGFGLHFAANLVKELEGLLQVESAGPGRGSTFRITLPRREILEQAA